MVDVSKRADAMRIIGSVVKNSKPRYEVGQKSPEYVLPAEEYEALADLFENLQQREII